MADSHKRNRGSSLDELMRSTFGHSGFRPFQEAVCRAVTEGHDVLLVMPTGAGKSLCYQLPGIARGGTTLVISPLIALMEDQVASSAGARARAERIHSGRDRLESAAGLRTTTSTGRSTSCSSHRNGSAFPGFPRCSPSASRC